MAEDKCVTPAGGIIAPEQTTAKASVLEGGAREESRMIARVGKEAPNFELSAYIDGGFKNIKLSDYKGKWIVVCFYPGDFTFV